MNGRIYDANLGRFLSADPTIQFPGDMQDYNRYSYVGNNPLKYTDPSGYSWWSKHVTKNFSKYWKVIVVIVIAVLVAWGVGLLLTGPLGMVMTGWSAVAVGAISGAAGGFAGGVTGSLLNGGSFSDALKAGLEGAAWGAVAGAAGGYIQGLKFGLESAKWIALCRATAMGLTGSAISYAQGGSLESGFLAGFAGGLAAGQFKSWSGKMFAGAIVGGCASTVGGGKFESGAVAGAFTALTYAALSSPQIQQKILNGAKATAVFAVDVAKKVWNLPNTALGLAWGGAGGCAAGLLPGVDMPTFGMENGRILITNLPKGIMPSAMSLGDVNLFNINYPPSSDNGVRIGVSTGIEEGLHSVQGRVLGPLYLPAHITGGLRSIFTPVDSAVFPWADPWHRNNFMETGPMQGRVF